MTAAVLDLPSTKAEAWRWSDPAAIARAAALPASAAVEVAGLWLDLPGDRLLFRDGVLDRDASRVVRVTFGDIAASDHPLGSRTGGSGWRLALDRDAAADPVQVVHLASGGANHLAAEIVLAEDAVAQVVETFVGSGWSNCATTIRLAPAARLMRSVQLLQDDGFVSLRDAVTVGQGASLINVTLGAGSAGSRVDAAVTLDGIGAFAEYGGALLTAGEQRQECAVRLRHAAPEGSSRQTWRAVAADASAASLAAAVEVARHAQRTDGEQSLRGLLLDRSATVNLKPELEIFADDVKCAHGATVGELDARALFYMQSRGIPAARARALLTRAFVADALGRIGDEVVRGAFEADADAWLERVLKSPSRVREGSGEGLSNG